MSVTLHIEHPITDLATWLGAFQRFAPAREKAGVRAEHIAQPIDDEHYIYVDLKFDSIDAAARFQRFLETTVWASPDNSPGLGGTPRSRILEEIRE